MQQPGKKQSSQQKAANKRFIKKALKDFQLLTFAFRFYGEEEWKIIELLVNDEHFKRPVAVSLKRLKFRNL